MVIIVPPPRQPGDPPPPPFNIQVRYAMLFGLVVLAVVAVAAKLVSAVGAGLGLF